MKKAMISISGICANVGITNVEHIDVYISIICSIVITIATLIATFKKSKTKTPKEIEIAPEDRKDNICGEQSDNNNINQVELEQQIIQTAHNIQDLINKRKGGDNNG